MADDAATADADRLRVAATAGATAISGYHCDQLLGAPLSTLFEAPPPPERLRAVVAAWLRRLDGILTDVCLRGFKSSPPLFSATIETIWPSREAASQVSAYDLQRLRRYLALAYL